MEPPVGEPLGFPRCPQCPYLRTGPPQLCLQCAQKSIENISVDACPVCSQIVIKGECPNWLCNDPDRRISKISAIAYSSGPLKKKIWNYKYDGKTGWAIIFGRLLHAWLYSAHQEPFPDLIIANPTFTGGGRFRHTEAVIDAAESEDTLGIWPFDTSEPRAITKTSATPQSAGTSAQAKRDVAQLVRESLRITRPDLVPGKNILVYDDVCTTGNQLNAIAQCLVDEGGASDVRAVVLARAPWRPRTTA
jgi:predicted amidophosphoribosyltransferase